MLLFLIAWRLQAHFSVRSWHARAVAWQQAKALAAPEAESKGSLQPAHLAWPCLQAAGQAMVFEASLQPSHYTAWPLAAGGAGGGKAGHAYDEQIRTRHRVHHNKAFLALLLVALAVADPVMHNKHPCGELG